MIVQENSELVAAGYIVTRWVPRPTHVEATLLPSRLLTASDCIGDMFPSLWGIHWTAISKSDRLSEAAKFGIAPEDLPRLIKRATRALDQNEFGLSHWWFSPQAACAMLKEFVPAYSELVLVGLGLPRDLVADFLAKANAEDRSGVCTMLRSQQSLAPGGTPLGWEALGYEFGGSFHSWLCNSLEKGASAKLGIRPAANGLLANEGDARAVAKFAERGNAEPVPWLPVLLVEYEIE